MQQAQDRVASISRAKELAAGMSAGWLYRNSRAAFLIAAEILTYVLALATLVAAFLIIKIPLGLTTVPNTHISVATTDELAMTVILMQVLLFTLAAGMVVLGRLIRASRLRRVRLQALCDAVRSIPNDEAL